MATRLNPYLHFPGTAAAAMAFYRDVFGGTLVSSTFAEMGSTGPEADGIMHSQLETDGGLVLMGSDLPPGMEHRPGENVTLSLTGDDADVLRGWFARLSEEGTLSVPLRTQMWGDEFGQCTDRFGTQWMVDITQPEG